MKTDGSVVVIGGGIGGLTASIALARSGFKVNVLEARSSVGGLASPLEIDGYRFDAGPYVLLDKPGLAWAFSQLGLDLERELSLRKLDEIYRVQIADQVALSLWSDLDRTAEQFENNWRGSGARYKKFVRRVESIYSQLSPLLVMSKPTPVDLVRAGAWKYAPFLLKSLGEVLDESGLPEPVKNAISIWTHIAGQTAQTAPSPMAFVPGLIHSVGAYYPMQGIGRVAEVLFEHAKSAGVNFEFDTRVKRIHFKNNSVSGVETTAGKYIASQVVLSNASGVGTYLEMADPPSAVRRKLDGLPLQSPGLCAYMAVRLKETASSYLQFLIPGGKQLCRLLVSPGVFEQGRNSKLTPARLISPLRHDEAERMNESEQESLLDALLAQQWWHGSVDSFEVLLKRTPKSWGRAFYLYRDSMNPVMTAQFMREGRLSHRSPLHKGLYLTGSSTHPGQWVSFCAISGVLAANCIESDSNGAGNG